VRKSYVKTLTKSINVLLLLEMLRSNITGHDSCEQNVHEKRAQQQ